MSKKDKETEQCPRKAEKPRSKKNRLRKLQAELCRLQDWVKHKGLRVSSSSRPRWRRQRGHHPRDHRALSPRVFRVVALPAPSDREKSQMYIQRYLQHFPAAGEVVIFDRSYYNRAGVEYVMGFCTKEQHRKFLEICPVVEKYSQMDASCCQVLARGQRQGTEAAVRARIADPVRQWKLSPMDLPSRTKWFGTAPAT